MSLKENYTRKHCAAPTQYLKIIVTLKTKTVISLVNTGNIQCCTISTKQHKPQCRNIILDCFRHVVRVKPIVSSVATVCVYPIYGCVIIMSIAETQVTRSTAPRQVSSYQI